MILYKTSLVPRPLPVFNDTRKKREGLVREVTCTAFRWKGDYHACVGHGPVTCLRVVLAVPIVPGTGIATDRRVAIAALRHVQVYGLSSPVHL